MSDIAIRVEGLGKQYKIGSRRQGYKTVRESIYAGAAKPFRAVRSLLSGNSKAATVENTFWALKDASFEVRHGDVVGIVGRNGAGKSTLLKLLSRITEPSAGKARIYGRVGSLLEVGTGFHPELTGRENVYLNGSILGMRRLEIDRKFDQIIAFAEIEKFLDTPVKHYSSGMYVRLAFSVAVHMDPEILVIDEVLAVGDAEFQKKCFAKMREIGRSGRTILFVSHNLSAVRQLCNKGIVVQQGAIVDNGEIGVVLDNHLATMFAHINGELALETENFIITEVSITNPNAAVIKTFDPLDVRVRFTAKNEIRDPGLYVGFLTADYQRVCGLDFRDFATADAVPEGAVGTLGFRIQSLPLLPGSYQLELHLKDMARQVIEFAPTTIPMQVVTTPVYGGRQLDGWFGNTALRAEVFSKTLV